MWWEQLSNQVDNIDIQQQEWASVEDIQRVESGMDSITDIRKQELIEEAEEAGSYYKLPDEKYKQYLSIVEWMPDRLTELYVIMRNKWVYDMSIPLKIEYYTLRSHYYEEQDGADYSENLAKILEQYEVK